MVEGVDAIPADQLMRLVASAGGGAEQLTNGFGRKIEDLKHAADSEDLDSPPDFSEVPTFKKGVPMLAQEYAEHAGAGLDNRFIRRPAGQALTVIGEPSARLVPRASISGAVSPAGASVLANGGASNGVSTALEAGLAYRVSLSGGASPGNAGGAQPVPAAADTGQPIFQSGERVHYWSETHAQWMDAIVKSLNYDRQGRPHTYDLNVKRGAQASRIRRWSPALDEQAVVRESEGLGALNGMGGLEGLGAVDGGSVYAAVVSQPFHETADAASGVSVCVAAGADGAAGLNGGLGLGETDSPPAFSPGDRVEYWSDTYSQWMQAVVTRIRENGPTYDLDVKKGAHRKKMRLVQKASAVPQARAAYDALSVQGGGAYHPGEAPFPVAPSALAAVAALVPAASGAPASGAAAGAIAAAQAAAEANVAPHTRRPSPITGHPGQRVNGAAATWGPCVAEILPNEQELAKQVDAQPYRVSIGAAPRATASIQAVANRPKNDVQLPLYNQGGAHAGSVASSSLAANVGTPSLASVTPLAANVTPMAASVTPMPGKVISGRTVQASGSSAVAAVMAPTTLSANPGAGASPARAYPHNGGTNTPPPALASMHQAAKSPSMAASTGASAALYAGIVAQTGPGTMTPTGEKIVVRQVVQADGTPASRLTGASFCMPENMANGRSSVSSAAGHRVSAASTISTSSAAVAMPAPAGHGWAADLEELQMGDGGFNPMQPALRSQLVQKLGLASGTTVEEMTGFRGGLNDGVWFLSDPSMGSARGGGGGELVLKLVRCHRIAASILTEAENYAKVRADHPTIVADPDVAYPLKMFSCVDSKGMKRHDLIVMRKVRGERLAELIAHKWYGNQVTQLMRVFEKIGFSLAEFHTRYGNKQHGDFQPSNIFYDEARDDVSFIDVGGMGVPTIENDQQHFQKSMNLMSSTYGQRLAVEGMQYFELGYARSKRHGKGA